MSHLDAPVFDAPSDVGRVETGGRWLGTEYGGDPLAFESRRAAEDMIERRTVLHDHLQWHREQRERGLL